jgi:hypothetical protein
MEPFQYLVKHVTTDIAPSTTHGIGTFALRDLEVGETLFGKWKGDTRIYTLSRTEFEVLPIHIKRMITKSYVQGDSYPVIWFRLFRDCYFNLANPIIYTNTLEENGNFDSITKKVIKPIKKGEEIFGTYNLKETQKYEYDI